MLFLRHGERVLLCYSHVISMRSLPSFLESVYVLRITLFTDTFCVPVYRGKLRRLQELGVPYWSGKAAPPWGGGSEDVL